MSDQLTEQQEGNIKTFIGLATQTLESNQAKIVEDTIRQQDLVRISSLLDTLHVTAPENVSVRASILERLYYNFGLRDALKKADIDDESRRGIINTIAGTEVAHPKGTERK